MKTQNFLIILCLLVLVFGCKKTGNDPVPDFKAKKDGEKWITTTSDAILNKINNTYMIIGRKHDTKYNQEENLFLFFSLANNSTVNSVTNFSSTWYYIVGSDQISDKYTIDSSSENSIQITSLDTINKTISGTFKVKLIRDKFYLEPEIMSFTQGIFNLPYQEVWNFE